MSYSSVDYDGRVKIGVEWAEARALLKKDYGDTFNAFPTIYVISKLHNKPPYKIGLTYQMASRMNSYRTALTSFFIYYMIVVPDKLLFKTEKAIHDMLPDRIAHSQMWTKSVGKPSYSEWFNVPLSKVNIALTVKLNIGVIFGARFMRIGTMRQHKYEIQQIKMPKYDEGVIEYSKSSGGKRELNTSNEITEVRVGGVLTPIQTKSLVALIRRKAKKRNIVGAHITAADGSEGEVVKEYKWRKQLKVKVDWGTHLGKKDIISYDRNKILKHIR